MRMIKAIVKQYLLKKRNYFLIATQGNTGSLWLASALNQYPDVYCTHGYDYPFPADGAEPREIETDEQTRRNQQTTNRLYDASLAELLHEMQSVTSKPIIGNVHAYTVSRLTRLLPSLPEKHRLRLRLFNMVRHPVTRVNSMYKMFVSESGDKLVDFIETAFETRCEHLRRYLQVNHQVELTNQVKSFVGSLLALEDITRDVILANQYGIENISFERVTTEPGYFAMLMNKIVNSYKPFNAKKAEAIFASTPKINRHNSEQNRDAKDQYEAWLPWQRDLYQYVVTRMAMDKIYAEFDYELQFEK